MKKNFFQKKQEQFLCRLEGIRRQQYTEEHHVFYGGGLRQVSEENETGWRIA